MAGSPTTKVIRDGNAATFNAREWDESGTGTGPFSAMQVLGDGLGNAAKFDLDSVFIVRTDTALGNLVSGNASNTDGTSTQVIVAGASGVRTYLTDVTLTNMSATNIYVEMKDGATVKWTFPVPANSGVTHHFRSPLAGTAATAWNFDPSAAATTIYCSASGFKSTI